MAKQGMKEADLESAIVDHLVSTGYAASDPSNFDLDHGIDTAEMFAFIGATQAQAWNSLVSRYGGDAGSAQAGFVRRVATELDRRGTIDVLRKGVTDRGSKIRLAYFKPSSGKNAAVSAQYAANRLTVTRQLRYSKRTGNTLDLALMVNGLLVATAELKNQLTGQTVEHAKAQYRTDRDAVKDPFLSRAVVHFAVDPYLVFMTTKLAGAGTTFLPFNQGRDGGAGNPDVADDFATNYLWKQVWAPEAWLDILGRFVHAAPGSGRVLFPRYHQWDVVTRIIADARQHGPGHNYLLQHSAGGGKSNEIAWAAHQLSVLHDATDRQMFQKVIVVTDRRVLDKQLRETIKEFEGTRGATEAITGEKGTKTAELVAALESHSARVVVTTLQTFPYILEAISGSKLASSHWAVIIDEAHSSQTGDAAAALRQALGAGVELPDDVEAGSALAELLAARGRQANMSFFAFTATPKSKTVEMFGQDLPGGTKGPFHLYSMRQAIEEGFILDVLAQYSTYRTYYRLATANAEAAEKEVDASAAGASLRRFLTRHPEVIHAKARIIVEHFRAHTAKKIGGQGKAMVVADSRIAAVKYHEAITAYCAEQGYSIEAAVAFSGHVDDPVLGRVTEASLNKYPESQTADRFKGVDAYAPGQHILIVAEKFQTGFDEPKLHTMFVDKTLTGLAAVQTLSRLNRTMPGKEDTFVLDFRNDADDIAREFQKYYEATTTTPTDPNVLSDAYDRVIRFGVMSAQEVRDIVAKHFGGADDVRLGKVYAAFAAPLSRFADLESEEQEEFRGALGSFLSLYSFMSQVLTWTDADAEALYVYGRALEALLPKRASGRLDLGSDVVLTHLRLEELGLQDIELEPGQAQPVTAFPGEGRGGGRDVRLERLGDITQSLNEAFGLNLTERDRLAFEQFEVSWLRDEGLREVARENTLPDFRLEFEKAFSRTILENEGANRDLYERLFHDKKFGATVLDWYLTRMYELFRSDAVQLALAPEQAKQT